MFFRKLFTFCLLFIAFASTAQPVINWPSPEVEQMYHQAREMHSNGKLLEAIAVYRRAIQIAPDILVLYRDLGQAYYVAGNYEDAIKTLEPIIKSGEADDQAYQALAASYAATDEKKKAKNMLTTGIDRFPHSGLLYHELGMLYFDEPEHALKTWLEGIEADPAYHVNYYEAAQMYMQTNKPVWAVIYGEMFINMEQQTARSNETRSMLIAAYKRLFNILALDEVPKFGGSKKGNEPKTFETAVFNTYMKLSPVVTDGITTENLTMLRTRFMMEWTHQFAATYPFTLFRRYDAMLRNGYFDIYNEWLFGRAESMTEYETWKKFHPEAVPHFEEWLKQHPLQPTAEDFYNTKSTAGIFIKKKKD